MTIFTETIFPRSPQGGMYADATGPFGGSAMQPGTMLGAQPPRSNSLADDLLVRLAGRYRAGEGSGPEEISSSDVQAMLAARGDRVGRQTPDEMVAQAFQERPTEAGAHANADGLHPFIAGITGDQVGEMFRRAGVADAASMINTPADIERAALTASRELMYWGTYSGEIPKPADFDHVYAAEEGGQQNESFVRKLKVGRAAFELLTLPNDVLEAIAADAQPDASQRDNQENVAASAARQVLQERRDPAQFVFMTDPNAADAWSAWPDNTSNGPQALQRAIALSVAGQKQLGVEDIQPFPQQVLKYINNRLNDSNVAKADKDALMEQLSGATDDPVVRAAMLRQLYHFGLARLVRNTALELQMTPAEAQATELEQAAKAGLQTKGQIWEYDPTLREKAGALVAGDGRPYGLRADIARALFGSAGLGNEGVSVADLTPFLGGVLSSQEAWRALEAGHYSEAALDALGAVPATGLGGKLGKKVIGEAAERILSKTGKDTASLTAEEFASRSANIYNPQPKPTRSIFDDYQDVVKADGNENLLVDSRTGRELSDPKTGKLLYDAERRRLGAERVVGRRTVGGNDIAILPEEHAAITKAAIGQGHTVVEAGALPKGVVGKYVVAPGPKGTERSILLLKTLSKEDASKVRAHEMGHMIDDLAGKIVGHDQAGPVRLIDQDGVKAELRWLYNDLNNPILQRDRAAGRAVEQSSSKLYRGFGPEQMGYRKGIESDRELMAEAIRAYMANPNYMKTVAPKTAARIRAYVNDNKDLKHIIQFNSFVGATGGTAGAIASFDSNQTKSVEQK